MSDGMDFDGARRLGALEQGGSMSWIDATARRLVHRRLAALEHGELRFVDAAGERVFGRGGCELSATVRVADPRFYRRLVLGGALGAAAAYIDGWWRADDLTSVIRLMARNRRAAEGLSGVLSSASEAVDRLVHRLRDNTRDGSRRNIAAHYDLGNDFYRLFLDETMMYSCAVFAGVGEHDGDPGEVLAAASRAKLDLICDKLELGPDDHVLEIGTGWGGFAMHAAERTGCRVTTTTISRRQHQYAVERVRRAGLEDRVEVLLEDYRDLRGRYDKLVSIEMIEAVGERYLELFFRRCSELLEDDGMMLLQAITIADQAYPRYRRSVDFIQRYVFPGSSIPSIAAITDRLARATDLRLFHLDDLTPDYAITLRLWRRRFLARLDSVRALGFDRRFERLWEYYLCYCEGGFAERVIGDVQMLLTKPLNRRAPLVASVRSAS